MTTADKLSLALFLWGMACIFVGGLACIPLTRADHQPSWAIPAILTGLLLSAAATINWVLT